ncbi:hypothetical protein HC931_14140 [Candidatus Gracilibacteria bacterium]|nr:hypothetical protein [Candidatus Gracilibacteria bacterium]NJM86539.1 hypothetical protein [Hydrococcus sp. RU_2_2]NJP19529.1 hypothetical protein [Hydrococcus sp. CRU_1_1]
MSISGLTLYLYLFWQSFLKKGNWETGDRTRNFIYYLPNPVSTTSCLFRYFKD